jgi:16S rRNA (guanine527-N7)-methyltransferase
MSKLNQALDEVFKGSLTNIQKIQFNTFYEQMIHYNNHTNLTRITEIDDVVVKHYYDSTWFLEHMTLFDKDVKVLDVGSGAGFPGIPILIMRPQITLHLLESVNKKARFLEQLKKDMSLSYEVIAERAENYALSNQYRYDCITFRAVGDLNILLEMTIPMLKKGGIIVALKGSDIEKELSDAKKTLIALHAIVENIYKLELPNGAGLRHVIVIKKLSHVLGYPRPYQQMIQKGL